MLTGQLTSKLSETYVLARTRYPDGAGGARNEQHSRTNEAWVSRLTLQPRHAAASRPISASLHRSDSNGGVNDGASYEVMSAGRQLLKSDDLPTQ